jgi:hypothetical protein
MFKHLHIISFDIPDPPIYGGIIDVYYKIKSLHNLGYDITLHCFQYNQKAESSTLNQFCKQVIYYPRKKAYKVFFSTMPYIVSSRSNDELLSNLIEDNDPIIFEGLHTCFYLAHPLLKERNKIVWMHNIEWDYYNNLSKADKNFIHKIHFSVESKKLKSFESDLKHAQTIISVNQNDAKYMEQYCENSVFIPPFHLNENISIKSGIGEYVLYHGSLDVVENHQAAVYLINTVFAKIDKKVIIAGKLPKSSLVDLIKKYPNISLRQDLPQVDLNTLIENAQCNILYTFQATGLKHKLLNTLYKGRHIIANDKMVANSGLESLYVEANTSEEIIQKIDELWTKELSEESKEKRMKVLLEHYSNESNAKQLEKYLVTSR